MSNKKGFSGLDDLSTNIDDIISENHKDIKNITEQKTQSKDDKTSFSNNDTVDTEKSKSTSSTTSNTSNTTDSDSNNGSSSWIWWLIAVGVIGWIAMQSNTESSSSKTSYSSSSQQNYSSSTQPNYTKTHLLTIITAPEGAKVRILNIKPKYQHGIKLEKGNYHIEVSKEGYETVNKWISLDKDMTYTIELTKIFKNSLNSASFDCTQAISKVENMICTNAEISALDGNMARLYKQILDAASDKEPIKVQQRNWITMRNECNDYACLKQSYKEQISKLEFITNSSKTTSDDYYESKPDVYLSILNKNQVLYCEAEKIRLNAVENKIDLYSTYEVDKYNSLSNDYNSRCANKQYYKSDMYDVNKNIEGRRYELQQEGLARFR